MGSCKKTCSICGTSGHNKRTCKKGRLIETIKEEFENKKKCSFCKLNGHDKGECEERVTFINLVASDCLAARRAILNRMGKYGLGVGALVSFQSMEYDEKDDLYKERNAVGIVTEILWDEISQLVRRGRRLDHAGILKVKWSAPGGVERTQRIILPELVTNFDSVFVDTINHSVKIISPIKVDIEKAAPKSFLDFEECVEAAKRYTSYGYL